MRVSSVDHVLDDFLLLPFSTDRPLRQAVIQTQRDAGSKRASATTMGCASKPCRRQQRMHLDLRCEVLEWIRLCRAQQTEQQAMSLSCKTQDMQMNNVRMMATHVTLELAEVRPQSICFTVSTLWLLLTPEQVGPFSSSLNVSPLVPRVLQWTGWFTPGPVNCFVT